MSEEQENIFEDLEPVKIPPRSANSNSVFDDLESIDESSRAELDEYQRAFNSIKDHGQLAYVNYVLSSPSATDDTIAESLKCPRSKIREYKNNPAIKAFITIYLRNRIKNAQLREVDSLSRLNESLDEEIDKRFKDLKNNRLDYEAMMNNKVSHQYAKLIMSTRIEGMTASELLKARSVLAERTSKIREIEDRDNGESADVIEELSINFRKYSKKKKSISADDFGPDADEFGTTTFEGE